MPESSFAASDAALHPVMIGAHPNVCGPCLGDQGQLLQLLLPSPAQRC